MTENEKRARRISDTIPAVRDLRRRRSRRVPLDADVTFLQPAETTGLTVDASPTGLRVIVNAEMRPGDKCVAVVQLPTGEEMHERARVVWTKRASSGWMTGLEFV